MQTPCRTEVEPGDTLIMYGRSERMRELEARRSDHTGDRAHEEAVEEQERELDEQEQQERERKEEE